MAGKFIRSFRWLIGCQIVRLLADICKNVLLCFHAAIKRDRVTPLKKALIAPLRPHWASKPGLRSLRLCRSAISSSAIFSAMSQRSHMRTEMLSGFIRNTKRSWD